MHSLTRRRVILSATQLSAAALGSGLLAATALAQPDTPSQPEPTPRKRPAIELKRVPDKGPRLDTNLVFEFVYFAHSNIDIVTDMLSEQPKLVNAAWDWGGGDWETALGGASHMGRRDIADLLLKHGARIDLFAATMLGKLDIVKATLAAFPGALQTPGPHGIPLIKHAEKGGDDAKAVLEYLKSLAAEPAPPPDSRK